MYPKINRIITIVLSLIVLGLTAISFAEKPSPKSLSVAALLGLTGSAAYHSEGIRKGIELAAEELRKGGWEIDLRYEDDQTNPAKTVSAMQFLSTQGYQLFIGPTWSFQIKAIKEFVLKNNIVAMAPAGSSDINGGATEGIFNLSPVRTQQISYVIEWLKNNRYHRAFIVTPNGDWGEIHRQVFNRAVTSSGGTVVGEEPFDYGIDIASLRTILLKGKQKNVDIVLITGAGADVANIVRARNSLHLDFAVLSTSDIRDALGLHLLTPQDIQKDVFAVGLTVGSSFRDRYVARYNEEPSLYSDRGYDALMLLAQATERSDGSVSSVRKFLKSGADLSGASGHIRFNDQGDIQEGDYQIVKVSL